MGSKNMDEYEHLKNDFLLKLEESLPKLTISDLNKICKSLDLSAYAYTISKKETALVPVADNMPSLVKVYLVVKKTEGLSSGTLDNYARILKLFFAFVGKKPEDVTANDIRMFIYQYQQQKNVSDRTLDKYREYICWFFHWAHTEEYITKNPGRPIRAIKYEQRERQSLTQLELEYLRLACRTLREKAILEFLYSTGCRVSELTNVKLSDINWKEGTVVLFGKGKKYRLGYINAKCEVALNEYLKFRSSDSLYLFVSERAPHGKLTKNSIENSIKRIASRSKVAKHVTPHIIRHTTATQAINNGMAIEEISKMLGHASVETTMIYAKVSKENIQTQHSKCII